MIKEDTELRQHFAHMRGDEVPFAVGSASMQFAVEGLLKGVTGGGVAEELQRLRSLVTELPDALLEIAGYADFERSGLRGQEKVYSPFMRAVRVMLQGVTCKGHFIHPARKCAIDGRAPSGFVATPIIHVTLLSRLQRVTVTGGNSKREAYSMAGFSGLLLNRAKIAKCLILKAFRNVLNQTLSMSKRGDNETEEVPIIGGIICKGWKNRLSRLSTIRNAFVFNAISYSIGLLNRHSMALNQGGQAL